MFRCIGGSRIPLVCAAHKGHLFWRRRRVCLFFFTFSLRLRCSCLGTRRSSSNSWQTWQCLCSIWTEQPCGEGSDGVGLDVSCTHQLAFPPFAVTLQYAFGTISWHWHGEEDHRRPRPSSPCVGYSRWIREDGLEAGHWRRQMRLVANGLWVSRALEIRGARQDFRTFLGLVLGAHGEGELVCVYTWRSCLGSFTGVEELKRVHSTASLPSAELRGRRSVSCGRPQGLLVLGSDAWAEYEVRSIRTTEYYRAQLSLASSTLPWPFDCRKGWRWQQQRRAGLQATCEEKKKKKRSMGCSTSAGSRSRCPVLVLNGNADQIGTGAGGTTGHDDSLARCSSRAPVWTWVKLHNLIGAMLVWRHEGKAGIF